MNKIWHMVVIGILLGGSGCKKQPQLGDIERDNVLNTERVFARAIAEGNKDWFLQCYAEDHFSQANAERHYERFRLYRDLYKIITDNFGAEGWKSYQSFEYGGGHDTALVAELAPGQIEDYISQLTVHFQNGKAIVHTPEGIKKVLTRQGANWVISLKDNPDAAIDEEFSDKNNKAYRLAITEAQLPNATIESVKTVFQDALDYKRF
jgi:hypothetical protein